jgi:hypothetical protein
MHKPNRKKNLKRKMMTITQAKLRGGQTRATSRENGLIVKKESLHNNGKHCGHLTPKRTVSCWTTDQC